MIVKNGLLGEQDRGRQRMQPEPPQNLVSFKDVLAIVGVLFGMLATVIGALIGVVYNKMVNEIAECSKQTDEIDDRLDKVATLIAQYQQTHVHTRQDLDRIIEDMRKIIAWRHKMDAEHALCFGDFRDVIRKGEHK